MGARIFVGVAVLSLCAAGAFAQQGTSSIGGKVVDQGGGVLPGVNLTITNEDTGISREVITGADGSYFVSQVNPGQYRISAKLEGFKTLERKNVLLEVGRSTPLDLALEVGGLQETVTVSSDAPLIDMTSAQVGGHISSSEMNELPQITRSYMALVGNVPGAQFSPAAGFLNDTMLANGQPAAANNVTIDGAGNVDDLRGTNVGGQARTANETLQEVQVMTNQFDAEFGRSSGAVINAVTKSGSNQISGSAFQFFTGKSVTAKDFFAIANNLDKPDVAKTEWGGTVGGPIIKNRLFYFFSLERVTQARSSVATFPNRPELNYSTVDAVGAWNTFLRYDHQITRNNAWALRWQREAAPQFPSYPVPAARINNGDETDLDQTFVGTLTSVVSNTKVNTLRLSRTTEMNVHGTPLIRNLKAAYNTCGPCPESMLFDQALLPPVLAYPSFSIQSGSGMNFFDDHSESVEDTFSWFVPNKLGGKHDVKLGAKFTYVWLREPNNGNANGTFSFNTELPFDVNDPRTYPERFTIRVPGAQQFDMISRVYEGYAQDKWQFKNALTLSIGVRYDLEVTPVSEVMNPLFKNANDYPVDRNNVAPRLGIIWNPDGKGRSVLRGGYGVFYDKTILGTIDDYGLNKKYSDSFTATFPQNAADPGPAAGRFPTDPTLSSGIFSVLTPAVRAYVNSIYPAGSVQRNTGTVTWDDPNRKEPYFHQMSVGYSRELFGGVSLSADYVRMLGRDLFYSPNLNLGTRASTARSGAVTFNDPFGILTPSLSPGEPAYVGTVQLRTTKYGYSTYDALDLSVDKRFSHHWSLRGAYSLGNSRGVASGQGDTPQLQVGNNLNNDLYYAPAGVDRRHSLTISGRADIPKTHGVTASGTLRLLSGTPFTIQNSNIDTDQNTIFFDPLPAGTYSTTADIGMKDVKFNGRRNGARGPGFVQLDMRFGYRARLGSKRTAEIFGEFFNLTNRANFNNPSGDLRTPADFLRYATLGGGNSKSRQAQLGLRLGF